jgi:putative tryptophan/tyrosine transport system substrate-binding protein
VACISTSTTIPIAFIAAQDPVALAFFSGELAAKRLDLLHDLLSRVVRVAVLVNPADAANTVSTLRDVEAAARAIGLQVQVLNASTSREINAVFENVGRDRPDALFVGANTFLNARRIQVVQLAAFHRLPAVYPTRDFVEVGGLMSYGTNVMDAFRQLGIYAGRILKGAKPADLPVVQSSSSIWSSTPRLPECLASPCLRCCSPAPTR